MDTKPHELGYEVRNLHKLIYLIYLLLLPCYRYLAVATLIWAPWGAALRPLTSMVVTWDVCRRRRMIMTVGKCEEYI
jgi:hypothetical protein